MKTGRTEAAPLKIADFDLAAYPVTVAQFQPFVEQGGYREQRYWSEDGWRWREEVNSSEPMRWNDPVWTQPNQPVIGISWYEAEAYCHWLNEQVHQPPGTFRLPTEAGWEWAARGVGRVGAIPGERTGKPGAATVGSLVLAAPARSAVFPGGAADWWQGL